MRYSIKYLVATLLLAIAAYPAMASHISGHDFTYVYLGDSAGFNHYRVTLTLYADCLNGDPSAIAADNPVILGVFTEDGAMVGSYTNVYFSSASSMPITASGPCDSGATILPLCNLQKVFVQDYYLPPSDSAYTIVYQRCCMNITLVNILNPTDAGVTATCIIPPSGIASNNNSAVFTNYPPTVIDINSPLVFDCSATDMDGDSLSYQICASYTDPDIAIPSGGVPPPMAPPYEPQTYIYPFSYSAPLSCSVPLAIDSITGLLTGTPNALGTYWVAVCANEWRGGVLINTVHREFEFYVASCAVPADTLTRQAVTGLYPNPSTSYIIISSTNEINRVVFINALGQRFDVSSLATFATAIGGASDLRAVNVDLTSIPNGLYFVEVNGKIGQKFVKEDSYYLHQ